MPQADHEDGDQGEVTEDEERPDRVEDEEADDRWGINIFTRDVCRQAEDDEAKDGQHDVCDPDEKPSLRHFGGVERKYLNLRVSRLIAKESGRFA